MTLKISDHLPVLGKFSIYLTVPLIEEVDHDVKLNANSEGKLTFEKIILVEYNFIELISELGIEPNFPFKLKLETYHFTLKKSVECRVVEIKVSQ